MPDAKHGIARENGLAKSARAIQESVMHIRPITTASIALVLAAISHAASSGWSQFRGGAFTAVADAEKPPVEFGPEKNLLWKADLPSGSSSPVIAGNRIFLTGFRDGQLEVLALSRRDGAVLWRKPVVVKQLETYFQKLGSPAASTCATDGERVVSYFGSFGLLCHDLDGKELWTLPLPLPQSKDGFGTGTSPILYEGIVYLLRDEDGPGQGLYAIDAKTGKERWRASRKDFRVSFGTPVVWDGALVTLGDTRAKGYDLKTGEEKWIVRGLSAYPCTTPTVGADGNLYIATWSPGTASEPMPAFDQLLGGMDADKDGKLSKAELAPTGFKDFFDVNDKNKNGFWEREEWEAGLTWMARGKNVVLAIKPGGKGDITETHVPWISEKGAPYVASPLAYEGRLWLAKDGGLLTTYDLATGKVIIDKQRLGVAGDFYMSPVGADGKVWLGAADGKVLVLKAGDKIEILATNDLGESLQATPAFIENKLYIRTAAHLWAFGAK